MFVYRNDYGLPERWFNDACLQVTQQVALVALKSKYPGCLQFYGTGQVFSAQYEWTVREDDDMDHSVVIQWLGTEYRNQLNNMGFAEEEICKSISRG